MRTERGKTSMIKFSAPGKIHLLGEHAVVYGKPALLAAIDLRVTISITPSSTAIASEQNEGIKKIIEPIVKKALNTKTIPPYNLTVSSQIPIGSGLGSSAAVSAAYIAALLSFLNVKWDLEDVSNLAYEAEKVFHGNPSGADNSTVVYGGLIWYRKETPDLKTITPLPFSIPAKLSNNFVIINTGTPKETTKNMVVSVNNLYARKPKIVNKFLENQERLVRDLLAAIKNSDEKEVIRIIREGEENLESIGVCSPTVAKIIRKIEQTGGAVKICGAGGKRKATGVLLCYHPNQDKIIKLVKSYNLPYFTTTLGGEGLKLEL